MDNTEILKLRRFALIISLVLIIYSIYGVKIDIDTSIAIFGIPLKIKNPNLIGIGIFIGSLYSLVRYFYYAILTGTTPNKARKLLLDNRFTNGARISTEKTVSSSFLDLDTCQDKLREEVDKYFPSLTDDPTPAEVLPDGRFYKFEIKPKKYFKILRRIHDMDYWLPICTNTIAIILFLIFILTKT